MLGLGNTQLQLCCSGKAESSGEKPQQCRCSFQLPGPDAIPHWLEAALMLQPGRRGLGKAEAAGMQLAVAWPQWENPPTTDVSLKPPSPGPELGCSGSQLVKVASHWCKEICLWLVIEPHVWELQDLNPVTINHDYNGCEQGATKNRALPSSNYINRVHSPHPQIRVQSRLVQHPAQM